MPTPFLTDTFSDTAGTNLSAHTPDTGGSWAYPAGAAGASMVITSAGRIRNNVAGQSQAIDSAATSGNASTLTWDLTAVTITGGYLGVGIGAPSQSSYLGYEARYDAGSGAWEIIGFGAGSYGLLGSVSYSLTAGTTYHCQFMVPDPAVSTTKTLCVNGSAVLSVTDNSYPTSGRVYLDANSASTPSDSTGMQVDNLNAYNSAFAPGSVTVLAPDSTGIVLSPGNQYIVPGTSLEWIHTATGAKFNFTGSSLAVNIDLSFLTSASISTANYPYLNWSIDNGAWQRVQITANPSLASGLGTGAHTAEIRFEPADESDTWTPHSAVRITGWVVDSASAIIAPTGNAAARAKLAMLMGDSISRGYAASNLTLQSFGVLLAHALNAELGIAAYSGQGWGKAATSVTPAFTSTFGYYDASHARTFPTLDYLIVAQGTNDGATSGLSAIVQSQIAAMRSAAGIRPLIVIVIPFNGQQDSVITAGVNAYITASADSRVLIVDLSGRNYGFLTGLGSSGTQYSVDGIHPTTEAHALIAADIAAAIKTFEAQPAVSTGSSRTVGGGVLAGI